MRKHLIQFLLVAVLLVFTSAAWAGQRISPVGKLSFKRIA